MHTFKLRRDYSWRWANENPVLSDGEPGLEKDTGKFKIGDGVTPWSGLDYFIPRDPSNSSNDNLVDHIESERPHPVYDDGPSLSLLYENAKV